MGVRGLGSIGVLALALCSQPLDAREDLVLRGTDSATRLINTLAAAFKQQSDKTVQVEGGGDTAAALACKAGRADIAYLSRKLTAKERRAGLTESTYAIQGVVVIVNRNNPMEDVSLDDLKKIYMGKTPKWKSGTSIMLLTPRKYAGARECFSQKVMQRSPLSLSAIVKTDASMTRAVRRIKSAIGYTAGSRADETVKTLRINGIAPTSETLRNKTYPLSRPLILATPSNPSSTAKAFVDFVLGPDGQEAVKKAGYEPVKSRVDVTKASNLTE